MVQLHPRKAQHILEIYPGKQQLKGITWWLNQDQWLIVPMTLQKPLAGGDPNCPPPALPVPPW